MFKHATFTPAICLLGSLLIFPACPLREAGHPTENDAGAPADGGTGEGLECEAEQAKIKALEAELAACAPDDPAGSTGTAK